MNKLYLAIERKLLGGGGELPLYGLSETRHCFEVDFRSRLRFWVQFLIKTEIFGLALPEEENSDVDFKANRRST